MRHASFAQISSKLVAMVHDINFSVVTEVNILFTHLHRNLKNIYITLYAEALTAMYLKEDIIIQF